VIGTYCPISGRYDSKAAFHEGTKALSSTWASPLKLKIQNIISDGRQAAVEMKAVDTKCKNGLPFTNEYTWVCEFNDENKIVAIRAYMDTWVVFYSLNGVGR
jgi:ketosteroid isomerase-like protein